jgi:hypothetical protein
MIKLHVVSKVPNHLKYDKLVMLKARSTYMGVHREIIRNDLDVACTKTALLGFLKQRDADQFKNIMVTQQSKKKQLNRTIVNGSMIEFVPYENKSAFLNIENEIVPKTFLVYTCIMQYLDMYIVDGLVKSGPNWEMYCYEMQTRELPNRDFLTELYQNFN